MRLKSSKKTAKRYRMPPRDEDGRSPPRHMITRSDAVEALSRRDALSMAC